MFSENLRKTILKWSSKDLQELKNKNKTKNMEKSFFF